MGGSEATKGRLGRRGVIEGFSQGLEGGMKERESSVKAGMRRFLGAAVGGSKGDNGGSEVEAEGEDEASL